MRALRLIVFALALTSFAMLAPSRAAIVQPHVGDQLTQTELFSYLFTSPQTKDWLRYRVRSGGNTLIYKTIGFGRADADENGHASIEITTSAVPVLGSPVGAAGSVGGATVWKIYLDAADFIDPMRQYHIAASAFKIGDGVFRLEDSKTLGPPTQTVSLQSLLLSGLLPLDDDRKGIVADVAPEDVTVAKTALHCVRIGVDYPQRPLAGGGNFPAEHIETWQSPDVPLGTVRVRTTVMGQTFTAELMAFGRGSYRPVLTQALSSMAAFPGSK